MFQESILNLNIKLMSLITKLDSQVYKETEAVFTNLDSMRHYNNHFLINNTAHTCIHYISKMIHLLTV